MRERDAPSGQLESLDGLTHVEIPHGNAVPSVEILLEPRLVGRAAMGRVNKVHTVDLGISAQEGRVGASPVERDGGRGHIKGVQDSRYALVRPENHLNLTEVFRLAASIHPETEGQNAGAH